MYACYLGRPLRFGGPGRLHSSTPLRAGPGSSEPNQILAIAKPRALPEKKILRHDKIVTTQPTETVHHFKLRERSEK